jgi:hypothetical protein
MRRAQTRDRVRRCRQREEDGLGWIGFWFDKEYLAFLLNHAVPRPGHPFTVDDTKDLSEGIRELLLRLTADVRVTDVDDDLV